MARFGQGLINSLINPGYGQGMFDAAQLAGSAPKRYQEQQQQSQAMELVNQALASNDPQQLLQAAKQMSAIDPNLSMKLAQAAQQATQGQQKRTLEQEQARAGRGVQGGLAAISQGAARGVPLEQLSEGVRSVIAQGGTQEDINKAYESGLPKTTANDRFKVVGNRIFDVKTQQYIEPSQAAEQLSLTQLKEVASPESIIEYAQTGDRNVLKPLDASAKESSMVVSQLTQTDNVLATVKEAAGLAENVFPLVYDLAKFGPNTDARALNGKISTLKANLSFDRLQKMRDESKTGGALGQVSNIELNLLGSNVAALDPASKDFAQQLKKVEDSYKMFRASLLGQKPPGDKYIEDNGRLYYVSEDEEGNEMFTDLGAFE